VHGLAKVRFRAQPENPELPQPTWHNQITIGTRGP
jgi:hypothetical protein